MEREMGKDTQINFPEKVNRFLRFKTRKQTEPPRRRQHFSGGANGKSQRFRMKLFFREQF
jgi:hypothetical protein